MNKKEQKELIKYLRADLAAARNRTEEGVTLRIRMANDLRARDDKIAALEKDLAKKPLATPPQGFLGEDQSALIKRLQDALHVAQARLTAVEPGLTAPSVTIKHLQMLVDAAHENAPQRSIFKIRLREQLTKINVYVPAGHTRNSPQPESEPDDAESRLAGRSAYDRSPGREGSRRRLSQDYTRRMAARKAAEEAK